MTLGINDSSASGHQFSPVNTFASTAQAKFGAASLDLTSSVLSGAYTTTQLTDFNFGSGQFTVEAWVYWTSHSAVTWEHVLSQWQSGQQCWELSMDTSGRLALYYSTTGSDTNSVGAAYTPTLNTWTHIAADRDASNVLRVYANGVVVASATVASTLFASNYQLWIGNNGATNQHMPGFIDEARISNVARFGGAFTPSASPYTADANTVLLVHLDVGALGSIGRKLTPLQAALLGTSPSGNVQQIGRAPTPGPKTVSGLVSVNGSGTAGLIVRAYAKATGELIGQATTAANGSYSIPCGANWADVTVIAYDPTTYQAIAFDRVQPA